MPGSSTLNASIVLAASLACAAMAFAQAPRPNPAGPTIDARQLVTLPEPMRTHTIANMRDHLLALQQINEALAKGQVDTASRLAETRLGMSSLETHGAAHIATFLPPPMQDIGTRMHRAASRFALEAQSAGAGSDLRPALASLGAVLQECVACHAAYRYQ